MSTPLSSRTLRAFVAIPCGDFYSVQANIICDVLNAAGLEPYVAEDDPKTKGLWENVRDQIDSCDLFIADISSRSPNILLEVGYAIARKPQFRIGVFTAESIEVPSDLRWLIIQTYSSLESFREKLITWLSGAAPIRKIPISTDRNLQDVFSEDFYSETLFHRRWSVPPGASYLLTAEGLRFSHAHFPIMTSGLEILRDCEFEFEGRIEHARLGWAIMGTKNPSAFLPTFCVMFTLSTESRITPHIWNASNVNPQSHYHVFNDSAVQASVSRSRDGWIRLITKICGTTVGVWSDGHRLFESDLAKPP